MCTFLSTLPKKSKTAGTAKKRNLVVSLRPCPTDSDGNMTWYIFRLLNFASPTGERDYPFIQRYIHQKWRINDKGYPEIEDEVICPVTKWMEWDEDRYTSCPICKYANQQFVALTESNWKDVDARKKNREFSRKYQAIIPVYVKNDPNYEGNNGKLKVIIFNDKKWYDEVFIKTLEKQLLKTNCFNGVNAVDCCIHMKETIEVVNEGQPNQYEWKKREIDKIAFTKPYDIPAITKELVDTMLPFDDTYYVGSTKEEIQAFYKKYIKVSYDNIVLDDSDDVKVYEEPKTKAVKKTNKVVDTLFENRKSNVVDDDITDDDLNDLTLDDPLKSDPDDEGLENGIEAASSAEDSETLSSTEKSDIDVEDVDELIKGLDDIDI